MTPGLCSSEIPRSNALLGASEGFSAIREIDTLLDLWKPCMPRSRKEQVQVLDFFSGCGGMSLGFAAVGQAMGVYRLIGAVDIDECSLASYQSNFCTTGIHDDIRDLTIDEASPRTFLEQLPGYVPSQPLVLIGCAPCQGFSAHRKKRWSELDPRNDLVKLFASIAAKIEPECILMENVPELLSQRYWEYFEGFRDQLQAKGYTVRQAIHNAAAYGTPQERFRAIVMAMKTDHFGFPAPLLEPKDYRTVRNAIGDLPPVKPGEKSNADPLHRGVAHRSSTIETIRAVPKDGGSRPPGVGPQCLDTVKGYSDVYGRLSWDKPAITITHYARNPASGRFVHPSQDRGLTMREAARLQGFPDHFRFEGALDDVFRQIGEAVPPHLATAIALQTLSNLKGEPCRNGHSLISHPVSDSYASVIAGIKMRRDQ